MEGKRVSAVELGNKTLGYLCGSHLKPYIREYDKREGDLSSSVATKARHAWSYRYTSLSSRRCSRSM